MDYHQVPSNSIEFHGTQLPPNEISLSSKKFHGTVILFNTMLPWTSMGYSMDFHGTPEAQKKSPSSMGFHGIRMAHLKWHKCSMELHGIFHGTLVPPNEISLSPMEFHGTLRLSFHSIPCYPGLALDIPWNSMELWSRLIKNHGVPWDSMELRGRHFKWHKCSMEFHGIFHGIPWNSGTAKWNIP